MFQEFDNSITYLRFNGSFFLEMKKEAHATKAFANLKEFLGRPPGVFYQVLYYQLGSNILKFWNFLFHRYR